MKKGPIVVICSILVWPIVFLIRRKKKIEEKQQEGKRNARRIAAEQRLLELKRNSDRLQKETEKVELISKTLQDIPKDNAEEMDKALTGLMEDLGVKSPWGDRDFDEFMSDPNSVLDFSDDSDN